MAPERGDWRARGGRTGARVRRRGGGGGGGGGGGSGGDRGDGDRACRRGAGDHRWWCGWRGRERRWGGGRGGGGRGGGGGRRGGRAGGQGWAGGRAGRRLRQRPPPQAGLRRRARSA